MACFVSRLPLKSIRAHNPDRRYDVVDFLSIEARQRWTKSGVGHLGRAVPAPADVRQSEFCDGIEVWPDFADLPPTQAAFVEFLNGHLHAEFSCAIGSVLERTCGGAKWLTGGSDGPRWKVLRYTAGGFFAAHTDSRVSDSHIGTLVVIPALEYAPFEGGELVIHPRTDEEAAPVTIAAHETLATFVFIPLGVVHEVRPVVRGVRYALTAPLHIRKEVLTVLEAQEHTKPVAMRADARPNAASIAWLGAQQEDRRRQIEKLHAAIASTDEEVGRLEAEPLVTRTARRVLDAGPMTGMFGVLLNGFYPTRSPSAFDHEDAATFNAMLRAYPGAAIRVVSVCFNQTDAHDITKSTPAQWEEALCERCYWSGQDGGGKQDPLMDLMSSLKTFYGHSTQPGDAGSYVSEYNDEGYDQITNLSGTVLIIATSGTPEPSAQASDATDEEKSDAASGGEHPGEPGEVEDNMRRKCATRATAAARETTVKRARRAAGEPRAKKAKKAKEATSKTQGEVAGSTKGASKKPTKAARPRRE